MALHIVGSGFQVTLPLLGPDDQPATFSVQLHFADVRDEASEGSVFDVQFNGATVLSDVNLSRANGHEASAVMHEVKNVSVKDNLKITLVPKQGIPLLNAVKVVGRNDIPVKQSEYAGHARAEIGDVDY